MSVADLGRAIKWWDKRVVLDEITYIHSMVEAVSQKHQRELDFLKDHNNVKDMAVAGEDGKVVSGKRVTRAPNWYRPDASSERHQPLADVAQSMEGRKDDEIVWDWCVLYRGNTIVFDSNEDGHI